jgi:broad specificity phosphatase PhoE
MGKLILVRHGHTHLNIPGKDERLRAWLDVPLDDQGLREAVETAERLAAYPVEAIYSSDLIRARQTADAVCHQTKAVVHSTNDLRPWNLGIFGGEKVAELIPFLNFLNQHPEVAAPSGESYHQFYGRYSNRLAQLMDLALRSSRAIVAVTHVRNLLATQTIIEQGDRNNVPVTGGPSTGTLVILENEGGIWQMRVDNGETRAVARSHFAEARA